MRITFRTGVLWSLAYAIIVILLPLVATGLELKWNEMGEWLAGSLAPLAVIWAAVGFYVQSRHLQIQSSEIQEQRQTMAKQLSLTEEQMRNQSTMIQQTERALATDRLSYAATFIPRYEAHLDVLAMYYVDGLDFESHGVGWPRSDKEPNYYIKKLTDEVESCLHFSKTPEKQAIIKKMDDDKNFQDFCDEFTKFMENVKNEKMEFLLSPDIRRLAFCLGVFFSRSRIRERKRITSQS